MTLFTNRPKRVGEPRPTSSPLADLFNRRRLKSVKGPKVICKHPADLINGALAAVKRRQSNDITSTQQCSTSKAYASQPQSELDYCRHKLPDFVMVYDKGQGAEVQKRRLYFEENLINEGLLLDLDADDASKVSFVKVYAPFWLLCRRAQRLQIKVPVRVDKAPADDQSKPSRFDKLFRFNATEERLIGAEDFRRVQVTAPFVQSRLDLYHCVDEERFFSANQRTRMVHDLLIRARCDPDNRKRHGIQWMLKMGAYVAVYPPHDGGNEYGHLDPNNKDQWSVRQVLRCTWANFAQSFKRQPLHLIRAYFGEKIAFYFAWLGYYTFMLTIPGVVGLLCFLYMVITAHSDEHLSEICHENNANVTMCPVCIPENCVPWTMEQSCESARWNYTFDNKCTFIITIVTLVWASFFLETWKRREARLAYQWDSFDVEQFSESLRPEYEEELRGKKVQANCYEYKVPLCKRLLSHSLSAMGILLLILVVMLAMLALIALRIEIYGMLKDFGGFWLVHQFDVTSMLIHLCTFVVVMTLGVVYEKSAYRLTDLECPRTQTAYLNSYIWKVFLFELLNNFCPILYAALIRGQNFTLPSEQTHLKEFCDPGGCLNEPVQAIAILLLARLLISNAAELGYPLLKKVVKGRRFGTSEVSPEGTAAPVKRSEEIRHNTQWRADLTLNDLNLDGVYTEYLEMMVQFGYVTLFICLFPLAPLICLLNNIVEIRLDAINFVLSYRRPIPYRVSGIDTWHTCLNIIFKLSIVTNSAVLAFTSESVPRFVYKTFFDSPNRSYLQFTLVPFNTTNWSSYTTIYPDSPVICYYRDTYQTSEQWQFVTIVRLALFITLVFFFYLIHVIIRALLPNVPSDVSNAMKQGNAIAREAFYGRELRIGSLDQSTVLSGATCLLEVEEENLSNSDKKSPTTTAATTRHRRKSDNKTTMV